VSWLSHGLAIVIGNLIGYSATNISKRAYTLEAMMFEPYNLSSSFILESLIKLGLTLFTI